MNITQKIDSYLFQQSKSQRAKADRIFNQQHDGFTVEPEEYGNYTVLVPSESSHDRYEVTLMTEETPHIIGFCSCPVSETQPDCKHIIAAVLMLEEFLTEKPQAIEKPAFTLDPSGFFAFNMGHISLMRLEELSGIRAGSVTVRKILAVSAGPLNTPELNFTCRQTGKKPLSMTILFDGQNTFRTKCSCASRAFPVCEHVVYAFYYLENKFGSGFFNRFRQFTEEKNKLLQPFSLTVQDPEAAGFQFAVTPMGEVRLHKKPDYLIPSGSEEFIQQLKGSILNNPDSTAKEIWPSLTAPPADYEIGFLFNFHSKRHIGFEIEPLFVRSRNGKPDFKRLLFNKPENLGFLQRLDGPLYQGLLSLNDNHLIGFFEQQGRMYMRRFINPLAQLSATDQAALQLYYFTQIHKLWPLLLNYSSNFTLANPSFSSSAVKPVQLATEPPLISFTAASDGRFITLTLHLKAGEVLLEDAEWELAGNLLIRYSGTLHLPQNRQDLAVLQQFILKRLLFPAGDALMVTREVIHPLQTRYSVNLDESLQYKIVAGEPIAQILVTEFEEKFLMLKPQFVYFGEEKDYSASETDFFMDLDGVQTLVKRNKVEELRHYDYMGTLHKAFATQRNDHFYFLPFADVMKAGWFVQMVHQVTEAGIPVLGLQNLKRFRYNTNPPKFEIKGSSGLDWFDLKVNVSWGDNQVPLSMLRKAILKNQEAVLLDDGTLGMIPQEWISRYGMLLKMGTEKEESMQVSKLHYDLLDALKENITGSDILEEIAAKKAKISQFNGRSDHAGQSSAVQAVLRPYQLAGFQWLQTLNELGWGGCLADDMGLGKTLQAITFLQYLKERHPGSTHLIVCPTSLVYNWENELRKFCPSLKFHTYYGNLRTIDDTHLESFDIILSTYGVIRQDVQHLAKFDWHYIILDESQAIKNPEAQVSRSVQLLRAKNKLIMSGTPVQNNTYDLYSQFHFLNPGFLGNREFFKQEFAGPIDKYGDKDKSAQLRRMVYPFMLRRTKEQVATDLPDKTETIIWCIMGKEQRAVYEEHKNYYRQMLLEKIEKQGMGKAGIYILEGLLRLRQICDSPELVTKKDAVKLKTRAQKKPSKAGSAKPLPVAESVKKEELMRELQENSGGHKLLVFSQFTEMLQLLQGALHEQSIKFCYLDGSTPAEQRMNEVTKFQQDAAVRVFLISLKAGGVGLNLTAADYVYLVDPWWNPAAEQQAIDRTHRIGQVRKVFAYKMICKDTVEEKILELQQKKKLLADELVSEEKGLLKKLTPEDIRFLFS